MCFFLVCFKARARNAFFWGIDWGMLIFFFALCHYCKVFLNSKYVVFKYLSVCGTIPLKVVLCLCFANIRSAQWVRLPMWTQTSLAMKSGKSFPWVLLLQWRKWWSSPSASPVSEISPSMTRSIFWRLAPLRWDHCVCIANLTSCASVWPCKNRTK